MFSLASLLTALLSAATWLGWAPTRWVPRCRPTTAPGWRECPDCLQTSGCRSPCTPASRRWRWGCRAPCRGWAARCLQARPGPAYQMCRPTRVHPPPTQVVPQTSFLSVSPDMKLSHFQGVPRRSPQQCSIQFSTEWERERKRGEKEREWEREKKRKKESAYIIKSSSIIM